MAFIELIPFLNLTVLTITLVILILYARDTNRIANQTQEANLRPVILRGGYLPGWPNLIPFRQNQSVSPTVIVFRNLKNIATDISGSIVIEKTKYQLLFGNEITGVNTNIIISGTEKLPQAQSIQFLSNWGWMQADGLIYAIISEQSRESVNGENQIFINYKDIEGNKFFTIEDLSFRQKCFKK